jgi:hypothetical protein
VRHKNHAQHKRKLHRIGGEAGSPISSGSVIWEEEERVESGFDSSAIVRKPDADAVVVCRSGPGLMGGRMGSRSGRFGLDGPRALLGP